MSFTYILYNANYKIMNRTKLYEIPPIGLDSHLAQLVVKLEPLRTRELSGTTPPWIFFGLKNLFQTIESVTSSQIEGNRTTIADYIEAARDGDSKQHRNESIKMILNVEKGLDWIESLDMAKQKIDKNFIYRLHRIAVDGLKTGSNDEGDARAGAWRNQPRSITQSEHQLPQPSDVNDLMEGLIKFIDKAVPTQLDLVKIALVHHRFVWIHPFGNGNGRVVRLLTYALLAKAGYIDKHGSRLLDPAAVFGADKNVYYDKLAGADDLSADGSLKWSEYMLGGLLDEIEKVDRLLDENIAKNEIIIPAIHYAFEKERISSLERDMLLICAERNVVAATDFKHLFTKGTSHVNVSQAIKKLRDQRLIEPINEGARRYNICMNRNALTTGIIGKLDENGFLPPSPEDEKRAE